jgi:hypothetical protein
MTASVHVGWKARVAMSQKSPTVSQATKDQPMPFDRVNENPPNPSGRKQWRYRATAIDPIASLVMARQYLPNTGKAKEMFRYGLGDARRCSTAVGIAR